MTAERITRRPEGFQQSSISSMHRAVLPYLCWTDDDPPPCLGLSVILTDEPTMIIRKPSKEIKCGH